MDLPSTTVDDILSAADANENGFEVSSTAVAMAILLQTLTLAAFV